MKNLKNKPLLETVLEIKWTTKKIILKILI